MPKADSQLLWHEVSLCISTNLNGMSGNIKFAIHLFYV